MKGINNRHQEAVSDLVMYIVYKIHVYYILTRKVESSVFEIGPLSSQRVICSAEKFLFVFLLGLLFPTVDKNKFLIDLRCSQVNQCLNFKVDQSNCIIHCKKMTLIKYCPGKTLRDAIYTNLYGLYLFSKEGNHFNCTCSLSYLK